jgi:hypothetical protein
MPDQWLLSIVIELRARAEELSVRADSFHDEEARQKMRRIAETYEKLAQRLERHARDGDSPCGSHQATRRGRRAPAGQAQQPCRQAYG